MQENQAREEIINKIKFGEFTALSPLLEQVTLSEEERSQIVCFWLDLKLPGVTKYYTEALHFGDFGRIKVTDAVIAKKLNEENTLGSR